MRTSGLFVVFEGPEGAGKSTQIQLLVQRLAALGQRTVATREPGGTPAADRIRALLLDPTLTIDPLPEFLLYAASRAQHVRERIRPALEGGAVVLCDRYTASSVAYQGYGRGLDPAWVGSVNEAATDGLRPDVTILLDLPAEQGLARIATRGAADRLEQADDGFHRRVRDGYLLQAEADASWTVIDARAGEGEVAEAVWAALQPHLVSHGAAR